MPYPKELKVHCPKYNQNVSIKTKPVTFGADATVCIRFLGQISLNKNGYLLISIPSYYSEKLFSYLCFNWMKDSEHINLFKKNDFIQILHENGLEVIKVKNKASNWFFNWLLLCLFGVRHKMGKPITKNEFQNIVVIIVNKLILIASKTRILFLVLDFFFPKSYLLYCKKNDS